MDSDRVKVGIYTSTNGTVTLIAAKRDAEKFIEDWQSIATEHITITGRLNDVDGNKLDIMLERAIVTGVEIIEINKNF